MKRIRYFVTVADEEHLHRAAERLHLAPSALSRQIKALEFELGVQLFERRSRGISLTQRGQIFKDQAVQLLRAYDNAAIEIQRVSGGAPGSLSIGVNEVVANNLRLLAVFREFRAKNPHVDVHFHFVTSIEQTEMLYASKLDIGFIYRFPRINKFLNAANLYEDRYCLVVNKAHRLAASDQVSFDDMRHDKFFCVSAVRYSNLWDLSFGRMISAGIVPTIVQEVNSHHEMLKLISLEYGSGFIHQSYNTEAFPDVVVRPVTDIENHFSLDAVWRKDNLSEALNLFLGVLGGSYQL